MLVQIAIQLPSSNYSLGSHSTYYNKDTNQVIAVWTVTQSDGFGMMMIMEGKAEKQIAVIGEPTVKHYLIGKTWGWGEEEEFGCTFITEDQIPSITAGFVSV